MQRHELKVFVEAFGCFVLRIYDQRGRCDFFALLQTAVKSVQQKELPQLLPSKSLAYCQPAEESSWNLGVLWKSLGGLFGQFDQVHGILRKRVVAGDSFAVGRQHKADGCTF